MDLRVKGMLNELPAYKTELKEWKVRNSAELDTRLTYGQCFFLVGNILGEKVLFTSCQLR